MCLVLVVSAVSACSVQSSTEPEVSVTTAPAPVPSESGTDMEFVPSDIAEAIASEVIGMSESDAIAKIEAVTDPPLTARVVRRDDENFVVTMDYRLDRINLEIDDDIVTKTSIG